MRRVWLGIAVGGLFASVCAAAEMRVIGHFQPRPALTLYLVNNGGPASVELTLNQGSRAEGDRVMIRLLDPDEQTVYRQYAEPGRVRESLQPGGGEVYGIPIKIPVVSKPGDLLLETKMPLTGPGIWQLRVTAGAHNSVVTVSLPPEVDYGVSFQNGDFTPWDARLERVFAWVPPHAEALDLAGGPVQVRDHTGNLRLESTDPKAAATVLPIAATGKLWTVAFPRPADWRLRAWGMPLILCPAAATAERLHASVEVCADGTVVCHKFQVRIHDLLPELLDPKHVGDTDTLAADVAKARQALLANPVRNALLMQSFDGLMAAVDPLLRSQNLDPRSHWAGVIGDWQEFADKPAPENRWDRLRDVPGLWGGGSPSASKAGAEKLAIAATVHLPGDLWHGRDELLWRAAAACLKDLMRLDENELYYTSEKDPYPGFMGFVVAQKTFPAYEIAAPRLPAAVRDLWTEGLARIVDRTYPDGLVSCRNQSSHYLVAYNAFANGSGLPAYQALADAYVQRWIRGQSAAGYMVEQMGPCASYVGMSNWHMAVAYRSRPDADLLDCIRRTYRFFNHTVAPEPDGTMLGSCNMNHRVGDSFVNEQWGGARGILDDLLPEVAAWTHTTPPDPAAAVKTIEDSIARGAGYLNPNYGPGGYNISWPRWQWWAPDAPAAPWPATETGPFIRNFADELIAVRRPGYYLTVYAGVSAPHPHYVSGRERFRHPYPDGDDSSGGKIDVRKVTPFNGGGLSLFWTPEYGSSILATDWTPLAHHGLVAWRPDDSRWWEEYFAVSHNLNAKVGILAVTGHLEQMPVTYVRTYTFADHEVRVDVLLTATGDVELKRLVENIPYPRGAAKSRQPRVHAATAETGAVHSDTVTIRDDNGAGLDIILDEARDLHLEPNGRQNNRLQIGRVEIVLPAVWKAGDTHRLRYRLVPVTGK